MFIEIDIEFLILVPIIVSLLLNVYLMYKVNRIDTELKIEKNTKYVCKECNQEIPRE